MRQIQVIPLGLTNYKSAWDLQRKIFELRVSGKIHDILLLTEHNHVYTLGKSSEDAHLLANDAELKSTGAEVYPTDRGGDITYHGPGQLVVYPILDLNNYYLDIHRYLRDLEEVIIRSLVDFGIKAHREEKFTGVWVDHEKIAAIGVKISRWITMHGFALNINTDLSYFDRIIPCGIFHKGITSIQKILGNAISVQDVSNSVLTHFSDVFDVRILETDKEVFLKFINQLTIENVECQK